MNSLAFSKPQKRRATISATLFSDRDYAEELDKKDDYYVLTGLGGDFDFADTFEKNLVGAL
ncbi:hypothetical protein [Gracilimonas sediminicola]|uniref:Uncharacterized protein n=1 Tax=Gracilimonas sediminicola TaxID=2952158 RepID=A0A9X2RE50_9BACT|nr:hypothetical protein [Gracilimonas sediminicola]MCP9289993.1 hypothetical protein [Gracilimonas sediminicola]